MEHLFLGTFLFGLFFTVASGVLGATHGGGHGDASGLPGKALGDGGTGNLLLKAPGDVGAGSHTALVDTSGPGSKLPPWVPRFNLTALIGFATWFGGAGWLAMTQLHVGPVLAAAAGVAAGWPAYRLIDGFYGLLRASETRRTEADSRLEGTIARVTVRAEAGEVGEIVFELNGQRRVEGARALEGGPLETGASVVITGYEAGLALVHPLQEAEEQPTTSVVEAREAPPQPRREPEPPLG